MDCEKQKHYLIYIITNKINGKIYVGCHQTSDIDDGYMGSGKLIKLATKKYGLENFNKDILIHCDSVEEMFFIERDIITQLDPDYNIHEGGNGGWDSVNKKQPNNEFRKLGGIASRGKNKDPSKMFTTESREKARNTLAKKYSNGELTPPFLGKTHTEKTKLKMSLSSQGSVPWNKGTAVWNLPKPCDVCHSDTIVGRCRSCSQKLASKTRSSNACKIVWPTNFELMASVAKIGYRATSRNLGISDTALRKHLGI